MLFPFIINVKVFYSVFDIICFVFAKIIYNTLTKLLNEDVFYGEELVRLALTSLMSKTKSEIKNQFFTGILTRFVDEDARTSFIGIVLLLSNSYFGENDDIRKVLQMYINKVDCITEAMQEMYQKGKEEATETIKEIKKEATEANSIKIGINLLENNYLIDEVSNLVEIPIDRLKEEYDKYLREKHTLSV